MSEEPPIAQEYYREVDPTYSMRNVPRFGHSSQFANIWATQEERRNYIEGLLFVGLLLFFFFLTWMVLLVLFKCLGRKRVGFLSGAPFFKHIDSGKTCDRPSVCRVIVMNAALFFIVFSVLFVTQGLSTLRTTTNTVIDSTSGISQIMADANALLVSMEQNAMNLTGERDRFVSQFESNVLSCLPPDIVTQANETSEALVASGDFLPAKIDEMLSSTERIGSMATSIEENAQQIQFGDWQYLVIIIPYIITPALLMVGVSAAWCESDWPRFRTFLSWIVLPIFILQILFAFSLSSAMTMGATANADFCSGGQSQTPDATVKQILVNMGYSSQEWSSSMLNYYVDQCTAQDPFALLREFQHGTNSTVAIISEWVYDVNEANNSTLSEQCQRSLQAISDLSLKLRGRVQSQDTNAKELIYLFRCQNIVPLYTYPTYDGVCDYSISGLTWAFSAFYVVSCMGLIMVTLRSTWNMDECESLISHVPRDDDSVKQSDVHDDEYGGYTGYDENNDNFGNVEDENSIIDKSSVQFLEEKVDRVEESPASSIFT